MNNTINLPTGKSNKAKAARKAFNKTLPGNWFVYVPESYLANKYGFRHFRTLEHIVKTYGFAGITHEFPAGEIQLNDSNEILDHSKRVKFGFYIFGAKELLPADHEMWTTLKSEYADEIAIFDYSVNIKYYTEGVDLQVLFVYKSLVE